MQLGMNARRLTQQRTGVGRYVEYLLKAWAQISLPFQRVRLYTPRPLACHEAHLGEPFTNCVVRPAHPGLLWEYGALPFATRGDDLFFSPSYTIPMGLRQPSVVTVHDVGGLRFRQAFPLWAYFRQTPFMRYSARHADAIIAVSEALKHDIIEWLHAPAERIRVIYYGVDVVFKPMRDESQRRATREQFGLGAQPLLLFVGLASKFRQTPELIQAFARLKHAYRIPHRLLLVGPEMYGLVLNDLITQHQLQGEVIHIKYLEHAALARIYNVADLLVYPSLSAGFPMPAMEAMASGLPVIAAGIPPIKEFITDAGAIFNTSEPAQMADDIHALINDAPRRSEYECRGLQRAAEFTWERTARETLEVLQAAAQWRRH